MRVVAGKFRGRTLKGPTSNAIRPTSDRLRESVFNILIHGYSDPIAGRARPGSFCRHGRAWH